MREWYGFPGYRRIRDTFEIDTVDDLIDRLETIAAAQDYPLPEPFHDPVNHRRERRSQFNDRRSQTIDRDLSQPPVPGYKDLPPSVNYQDPNRALQIPQASPPHGRRAHNPKFAKQAGIPQKVAKEFNQADKGTGILKPKRRR